MRVVNARPPMFEAIDRAFNVAGRRVIFAFGDLIYNPEAIAIGPELFAHEQVHGERQGRDPAAWWATYIEDPEFRLAEEIPAHQAEFAEICRRQPDRNRRAKALHEIAAKLASPLYGRLIDAVAARKILQEAR